jgi:hypothetical protein
MFSVFAEIWMDSNDEVVEELVVDGTVGLELGF